MSVVSFDATRVEQVLIERVVERAEGLGLVDDELGMNMDLTATHANGCPLDFERLLAFDDFSFTHDITGIQAYLDRSTGKLTRHFLPRSCRQMAGNATRDSLVSGSEDPCSQTHACLDLSSDSAHNSTV